MRIDNYRPSLLACRRAEPLASLSLCSWGRHLGWPPSAAPARSSGGPRGHSAAEMRAAKLRFCADARYCCAASLAKGSPDSSTTWRPLRVATSNCPPAHLKLTPTSGKVGLNLFLVLKMRKFKRQRCLSSVFKVASRRQTSRHDKFKRKRPEVVRTSTSRRASKHTETRSERVEWNQKWSFEEVANAEEDNKWPTRAGAKPINLRVESARSRWRRFIDAEQNASSLWTDKATLDLQLATCNSRG